MYTISLLSADQHITQHKCKDKYISNVLSQFWKKPYTQMKQKGKVKQVAE